MTAARRQPGLAPEWLFLIASAIAGLLLVAMIPPLGGGNEQMNFQRSASIANGQPLVKPVRVPGGLVEMSRAADERFSEGAKPPFGFSRADRDRLGEIGLHADRPVVSRPNPIAVLNPVSYAPQSIGIAVAQALALAPLAIFTAGRLAGLAAALALTFFAIRIMPVRKAGLAAVAMLPPILFSRSTLDADQMTNGLAFLFLALAIREIAANGRMSGARIAALAVTAFLLAQSKSAYLLLPLISLAIPARRFASPKGQWLACAVIVIPGLVASLAWMVMLKQSYFAHVRYRTWSGLVDPDAQLAFILAHPFGYAATLLRTVFTTPFIPKSLIDLFGVFGPPVMLPLAIVVALAAMFTFAVAGDERLRPSSLTAVRTRALTGAIAAVTFAIIVTLLYLQWTQVRGPVVHGFTGRYLYPLAPLALLLIPSAGRPLFGLSASAWLHLLTAASVAATLWMTWRTYLA